MQDQQGLGGLAPVYALLARILASEIDDALVTVLREDAAAPILEQVTPGIGAYLAEFDVAAKERADEEFCALFLLPGGVAPRAASWMEGELATVGARISQLAQNYLDRLGRDLSEAPVEGQHWGKLPLDHASVLLHLTASAGDDAVARDLVWPWAAAFGRALSAKAKTPVYRAAGELMVALGEGASSDDGARGAA